MSATEGWDYLKVFDKNTQEAHCRRDCYGQENKCFVQTSRYCCDIFVRWYDFGQ
jgi:hypothetical protein